MFYKNFCIELLLDCKSQLEIKEEFLLLNKTNLIIFEKYKKRLLYSIYEKLKKL